MSVTTVKSSASQNYADFYQASLPTPLLKEILMTIRKISSMPT